MNKKKLQVEGIMNELEGASLFFSPTVPKSTPAVASISQLMQEKNQENPPTKSQVDIDLIKDNSIKSNGHLSLSESSPSPIQTKSTEKQISRVPKKKNEPTNVETNERTYERINERFKKRTKIRHTFDIFADQLLSLREISIEQEKFSGERVLLGELAQQALEMFISKQRNK